MISSAVCCFLSILLFSSSSISAPQQCPSSTKTSSLAAAGVLLDGGTSVSLAVWGDDKFAHSTFGGRLGALSYTGSSSYSPSGISVAGVLWSSIGAGPTVNSRNITSFVPTFGFSANVYVGIGNGGREIFSDCPKCATWPTADGSNVYIQIVGITAKDCSCSQVAATLLSNGTLVGRGVDANGLLDFPSNVDFKRVALGPTHMCGIGGSASLMYCWGSNATGQLGDPAVLAQGGWKDVSIGQGVLARAWVDVTCGINMVGAVVCWPPSAANPLLLPPGHEWIALALGFAFDYQSAAVIAGNNAGGSSACAIDTASQLFCSIIDVRGAQAFSLSGEGGQFLGNLFR